MQFILVLVVILTTGVDTPPHVEAIEFNSEHACQTAATALEETISRMQSNTLVTTRCFPKGG